MKVDHFFALCNLPPSADTGKNNLLFLSGTGKSRSFAEAVTVPDTQLPRKLAEAKNSYSWTSLNISALVSYNVTSLTYHQHVTTGKVSSLKYHKSLEISTCVIYPRIEHDSATSNKTALNFL